MDGLTPRHVRRRSIAADIERAKRSLSQKVDRQTLTMARDAHLLDRHEHHPDEFSRVCYICLAFVRRRRRRDLIMKRTDG